MSSYIPVIGLEIHAELLTKSKVFCTCSAEFGGSQNSRCCPVCTGMPGTLPVINQTAVEYAVKAGFALGCDINKFSVFDRKNYFYPDLPKAYQISQLYRPLCLEGKVEIETSAGKKDIRINHIHLEEDAGKLVHDDFNAVSLADYNRCGIPLVEIVTEPDISSAEEAKAFIEKVILLLQYAGVSDCKMEEGSLRCDVNVSIMRPGDTKLGTRAEIKNMNSLKSITRAINYEIKRQSRLLDAGKQVVQETRRFNENKGETSSMRSKENAHDYRYFPEPDILQVNFTDEMLDSIKAMLPELPHKRMKRYTEQYGLSKTDAQILINQKRVSDFYDEAVAAYNQPKSIANFIIVELLRRVNLGEVSMEALPFTAQEFAELVQMADTEKVSKNDAKKILRQMIETGKDAKTIAQQSGMLIVNDTAKAEEMIASILSENAAAVTQYQNGEKKVFGFLMGQCTKVLRGVCTPGVIKDLLEKKLTEAVPQAEAEDSQKQDTETKAAVENACTPFANEAKYQPERKDGILQIGTDHLLHEFDFADAADHVGKEITIRACVHKIRQMSGFAFVILRTGRYLIQSLYTPEQCKDSMDGLREGNFVWIRGTVTKNEKAVGGVEVQLSELQVIANSNAEYPLKVSNKKLGCALDINLDNRSVALRNVYERAIFKIQEGVVGGFREFMLKEGFTEIHSPKIVAQGAEGGANIFHLEYFDKPAFLNQSPQFYKQTAVAFFDRVFEIAPVYRAEKHATSRHINEYIGLDFEMGYIDSMYDVMAMETAMLRYVMDYLRANYAYELELLEADIPVIHEIPSVTLLEAKEILGNKGSKNKLDLEPEDEVAICEYAKETFGSDFIFVTHFPSSKPPFYAMNSREDPRLAYKFDLLFRGLEITSGGQRIHDYQEQLDKMHAQGLDPEDFKYYLEAHKYGLPPHGGLGIGLERLVMKLLGLSNVRQASMFPRDINRLLP
ncbi:Asp-tRNA(Asn)/Glu-tRNA(Gln) amidotransferase subunit GatB [uncultured Ruminococcus sp.]|uniref:Asp-tRNA(Asn)/Glu-tRNA(Gln) amidotransferase subunit GatB n=1 Tax=uncultured Ruminococcus sp. TaxID=165186 RepID=UPI0029435453|nr:Asp-tRNA(Asn)/Glu-tRNA(Gln) amidotransferase subunit GatB [uncultured Ruminococcus sp.]